jgi:dTDP-glucose 4,6-dehydratase
MKKGGEWMAERLVLVTGAAGFLGSHLCDALLAEGHQVVGVDNLSTGNLENLSHLKDEPRFFFEQIDITQPFDVGKVDYVFNFASPASPVDYMRLGIETLLVGSAGTLNTLEIAKKYGAGYLHASTSECYGDPLVHPQVESYWGNVNPIGPRSVYDEAKRFSEAAVSAYLRYHGVNTHLVRIFNTYGPRLQPRDGRLISNLVMQALRGEPLTIYGDGSQTRSFCYCSDLIDGILRLSQSDVHDPVNIGNPQEWTILECAQQVQSVVGSRSEIVFEPLPQDDPLRRRPDITLARNLLGWSPKIALREGLERSMQYFAACIENEKARV